TPPSRDIAITILGDAPDGKDPETFSVNLVSAYNGLLSATGKSAVGTITQIPPQPPVLVNIANFTMNAPATGSTIFYVPVTLSAPPTQQVIVYFSTTPGSATSPLNYNGVYNGHVAFAPGQ